VRYDGVQYIVNIFKTTTQAYFFFFIDRHGDGFKNDFYDFSVVCSIENNN